MIGELLCTSVLYGLFSLIIVFPPQEAVSAGITVENLLSPWLKSESLSFVEYHIKRTSATIIAHSLLLPGYVYTLVYFHPWIWESGKALYPWGVLEFIFGLSCIPLCVLAVMIFKWKKENWKTHPLLKTINLYCDSERSINSIVNEINNEFAGIDKVTSELNSVSRVIATENWLIKVTSYYVHLISLRDAVLVLENCEEAQLVSESTSPAQFVTARVASVKEGVKSFHIRVNSVLWTEIERKLRNPPVNTKHLVIHQTLADRFSVAFEKAIEANPKEKIESELENCIGCMAVKANVRLDRRCREGDVPSECTPCSCRPMWCVMCLSKWFAARQDPNQTSSWLSSRAPCPTCRSKFCLLDVCIVYN